MTQNSDRPASTRRRGPGRPFPKGVSGNPGGRPKDGLSLASLLRTELEKDGGGGKTKGELIRSLNGFSQLAMEAHLSRSAQLAIDRLPQRRVRQLVGTRATGTRVLPLANDLGAQRFI